MASNARKQKRAAQAAKASNPQGVINYAKNHSSGAFNYTGGDAITEAEFNRRASLKSQPPPMAKINRGQGWQTLTPGEVISPVKSDPVPQIDSFRTGRLPYSFEESRDLVPIKASQVNQHPNRAPLPNSNSWSSSPTFIAAWNKANPVPTGGPNSSNTNFEDFEELSRRQGRSLANGNSGPIPNNRAMIPYIPQASNTQVNSNTSSGTSASKASDSFTSRARMGRNAMAGMAVGAAIGALNPAGDDGLIRGAAGGAMVGATLGGLAGAANGFFNEAGNDYIGKSGKFAPNRAMGGKLGAVLSVGGAAGVIGGLLGGSGPGKRNTTIGTNGWSQGTHPSYF
jgi:hypothetical protein